MGEGFVRDIEELDYAVIQAGNSVAAVHDGLEEIVRLAGTTGDSSYGATATRQAYEQICQELSEDVDAFNEDYDTAQKAASEDSTAMDQIEASYELAVKKATAIFAGIQTQYDEMSEEEKARAHQQAVEDRCGINIGKNYRTEY